MSPFFETLDSQKPLEAYIDGSCLGNPGVGGWGVFFVQKPHTLDLWGGVPETTNNRMEMQAAVEALKAVPLEFTLHLWTDSTYLRDGITLWIKKWRQKGWLTSNKEPVKNQDLWKEIDRLAQDRPVSWFWVKGHNDHEGNMRADSLAKKGAIGQKIRGVHSNT